MADSLSKSGIYFDELNKFRVLEPAVYQQTNELKEECTSFVERFAEFYKITEGITTIVGKEAQEVEKEKMKAIGTRNLLKFVSKQREATQQQLQGLIIEKSTELERLITQYQSLQRIEIEQQETMDHLILHH